MPSDPFVRFDPTDREEDMIIKGATILDECYCPQYREMFADLCNVGTPPDIVTSFFVSHFVSSIVGLSTVFITESNSIPVDLAVPLANELGSDIKAALVKYQKACMKLKGGMN